MAANKFGRYVWLIDLIRSHPRITFKEISDHWEHSGLGDGEALPWRTFMNHKKAVESIFDVLIECDAKSGYGYYIDEAEWREGDGLRSWLIDSYATLNQLQADKQLQGRISFERIPSGNTYLQVLLQAMRQNHTVRITHQGFGKPSGSTFEIEPYHLKVVNRRWYLIGRNAYYDTVRIYALDRIHRVVVTDECFRLPKSFDINDYFKGCVGIIADQSIPIRRIVVKAYDWAKHYLETLPIHESQKEIGRDDESITFEFHVRPTYDFLQVLLQQADQIEIVEPESVKKEICNFAENILSYYK